MRILRGTESGQAITIFVDGERLQVHPGETVAGALLAAGRRAWRRTRNQGAPRGLFCGMGVCFDCLVQVDGEPYVRACMTLVAEGMEVETYQKVLRRRRDEL